MNKKGFTLIELLAVIVILAVIALIVTPIVTGIIRSAKEQANARSLEDVESLTSQLEQAGFECYGGMFGDIFRCNIPAEVDDVDHIGIIIQTNNVVIEDQKYSDGSYYCSVPLSRNGSNGNDIVGCH